MVNEIFCILLFFPKVERKSEAKAKWGPSGSPKFSQGIPNDRGQMYDAETSGLNLQIFGRLPFTCDPLGPCGALLILRIYDLLQFLTPLAHPV